MDKKLKSEIRQLADKVVFKNNGNIVFKQSYFYHHGLTPDNFSSCIKRTLTALKINCEIVDSFDDWKAWPKTSYIVCEMKVLD